MISPHSLRKFAGMFALVAIIGCPSGIAMADTTVDFTLNAEASSAVCSVTASAGGLVDVHRVWNGTATFWEPVSGSGPLTLAFDTTGLPGDRNCYSTASNTDFTDTTGTITFVPAGALSMTEDDSPVYFGQTTPRSFIDVTDIPSGGATVNLTWYIISSGPPNMNAPAGAYTSTLTITLSSSDI